MRFLKYLVLLLLISFQVHATIYIPSGGAATGKEFDTGIAACKATFPTYSGVSYKDHNDKEGGCYNGSYYFAPVIKKPSPICPKKDSLHVAWLPSGTKSIPIRMCIDNCTYEGSGLAIDTPNYVQTSLFATGDQFNCKNINTDTPPPKCDSTDPYGECYVPPDDDCVRSKDGSITCPPNKPPIPNDTCNGATYCKKPPTGCGTGYVSGSFNGQELCVKSGPSTPPVTPNDPNDPNDPNKCTISYCPKPDDNKDCPDGYYQSIYNGQKICVKNDPNPNDPNPNPNDPNNPNDPPPSSDPSSNDVDLKPVLDAIKSLKDALLSSLSTISKKITDLVDGQKKTNETLEKSDKHLENIEKSSQAASEATAQTNEKLDDLKDAIEGQYKCNNNSYNPNDPHSSKYRECTESDLPFPNSSSPSDTNIDIGDISVGDYESNYVSWSAQCPPDNHVSINLMGQSSTLVLSWSPWCELLSKIRWAIIACAYFAAAYIILGMR